MSDKTPHDALFKEIFSSPEHARVELMAVIPQEVTRRIDWSTLRVVPGSFVELGETDRFADLLFTVQLAGSEAFIYILFEHQSKPEPFMLLRLLEYMLRNWQQFLRENPGRLPLPPIIPVVLHHSEEGWTTPVSFHDLFDVKQLASSNLTPFVPSFRFVLDDISHKTDAELLAASLLTWAKAMELVLRAPTGPAALKAVLTYISIVADSLTPSAILAAVEAASPETKETVMTLAEQWTQEGIEKGRQEGRQEGIAKGERAILMKQLALKFGTLDPETQAKIDAAPPPDLELWAERILTASTVDEVLR